MSYEQHALDFSSPPITIGRARVLRDEGMALASDAADRRSPRWSDVAYQFLERFARTHALINPEDVCDAAAAWGLSAPTDERAWGGVYRRAVNKGLIERSDLFYQRRKGHATESRMWRSRVSP